MDVLINITEN